MATYNGTSGNGTYAGGNASDSIHGFAGNGGILANEIMANAVEELPNYSIFATNTGLKLLKSTKAYASNNGLFYKPSDQVVG